MNSVLTLILQRLFYSLGTLALVSIIIFAAVEVLPGDVAARILGRESRRRRRAYSCAPNSASTAPWSSAT